MKMQKKKKYCYDDMDNVNTGLSLMFPKSINETEKINYVFGNLIKK